MAWASLALFLGIQIAGADRDQKAAERRTLELAKEAVVYETKRLLSHNQDEHSLALLAQVGGAANEENRRMVDNFAVTLINRAVDKLNAEEIHAHAAPIVPENETKVEEGKITSAPARMV